MISLCPDSPSMKKIILSPLRDLERPVPQHFQVSKLDLVLIRVGNEVSPLYGRCPSDAILSTTDYSIHPLKSFAYAGVQ